MIVLIKKDQFLIVKRYLPDTADRLIASGDVNALLEALDDLYLDLLDENQEPTDESRQVECLRDQIHWQNTH